jgi:glycosyltransferase involved in cell wall biosynthesis
MTRQLLVDCSCTRTCEFNSGIQRVVRSLCKEACEPRDKFVGRAVFGHQGDWYAAKSLWPSPPKANLLPGKKTLGSRLRKLSGKLAKSLFPSSYLHGRPLLATLKSDDVLLMADAGWMFPNWEGIQRAKQQGVKVGFIIYDLLPIDYPHFFPEKLFLAFGHWFKRVSEIADFLVCISQTVRLNVVKKLLSEPSTIELAHRTGWFRLGCALKESRSSNTQITEELIEVFSDKYPSNPWLMVGTLEPRKNHSFVLDSFEKLWREGCSERLLILGRVGWNCDALMHRIRSHAEFGKRLFMSNQSNDAEVEFAYRKSKGVITSSWDEGFGLPIVEGLHYNGKVLASDIPVHREVGAERVRYFSLNAPDSLAESLAHGFENHEDRDMFGRPGYALTTWSDSYRSLISSIEEMISRANTRSIPQVTNPSSARIAA